MLDIRKIKENPDAVKAGLKAKEVDCDAIIDRILELDVQIRALKNGESKVKNFILFLLTVLCEVVAIILWFEFWERSMGV